MTNSFDALVLYPAATGTDPGLLTFDLDLMLADLNSPEATLIKGSRVGLALWAAARARPRPLDHPQELAPCYGESAERTPLLIEAGCVIMTQADLAFSR